MKISNLYLSLHLDYQLFQVLGPSTENGSETAPRIAIRALSPLRLRSAKRLGAEGYAQRASDFRAVPLRRHDHLGHGAVAICSHWLYNNDRVSESVDAIDAVDEQSARIGGYAVRANCENAHRSPITVSPMQRSSCY